MVSSMFIMVGTVTANSSRPVHLRSSYPRLDYRKPGYGPDRAGQSTSPKTLQFQGVVFVWVPARGSSNMPLGSDEVSFISFHTDI